MSSQNCTVTLTSAGGVTVEIGLAALAFVGGGGGGDATSLGGIPVSLTSPQTNDVLQLVGGQWVNTPQIEITSGGTY